jgi:ABC-type Mn2+/Zn2+ transport system permease subunit
VKDWQTYVEMVEVIEPALIAASGLAVGGALLGVFAVLRREALVALALPQVVAVGAAVGARMGWSFLPPALAAAAAALLIVAWARVRGAAHLLLPALYVGGLSLSVLVIANSAQHLHDIQHLLAGQDVFVTERQAWTVTPVLIACGLIAALLWRRWLLLAQSATTAQLAGLRPARWNALFLLLLAAVVVVGTSASGILMVLACLFLPAGAVLPWARRIPIAMSASVIVALLLVLGGFFLSVEMDWPLSQSIGGVGLAVVVASHAARSMQT